MLFRLLGPLEVTDAERPLRIGAGRQRSVLLMLLVHRNEVVASERLVDALWGEEPPPTAAKVLQNAVGQLRRALGDQEARRLQTRGHGYVMRVAQGELDVDRFEELVQDGGRTLADGRPGEAAARLREALVLWRGPPLADATYEAFAQPEIARLEELFATALERRIEAELALGAHADLVSELEALVARHPLRERLRGQLMLALYRCGRQADALEAFREGRRLLVEEVGVEPGPELRQLHEAILRQEPGLAFQRPELPPELDARSAPPLAGRQEELRWLLEQWLRARDGDGALIGLSGEPGIGKTRLAAELAGEVHGAGALVVYARGTDCEVAVARAREPGRPVLIVLEDPEVEGPAWRAGDVADMVLVTADDQHRLAALGVTASLALGPLDAHAVTAIASAYTPDRSATEVPADELLEASGGVPRRVHEAAKAWAAREAARRVVDIAPAAAADRSRLRQTEARLAGRLLELQETRERLDRFNDGDALVVCPFKGLASFEFADAPYFAGRERLIAELVARAVGAPLLGLVGPSGSGKSSLVRAGLLPALAAGVLPGSTEWPMALIRPGEHPMRELAEADRHAGVLAVDQLEELFTACRNEDERRAFAEALALAASRRDGDGLVVVALRADYYGRCAAYPALSRLLGANHLLVGPMEAHELRRAIERPAARAGLEVDGAVVDSIVADVKGEPGALPLVSSALLELWQRRDGRRLRHDTYEATGGVRGAVARLAESAFAQLDPGQQRSARDLLVRLAADGPAGEVVRRRVQLNDLNAETEGDVRRVLELLAEHRLLTVSATSVEVAHEALLREWPRLRGWLETDAQSRRVHRHLSQAATDWQERGGDPADLYRGARLAVAQEWRGGHENQLNAEERAFLDASRTAAERHQRRLRLALAGVAALLAVAILGAIVAVHQRGAARRQARTAEAQRVGLQALTEPDLARSLLLAREGVALADSAVTRGNLFSALVRYPSALAEVQSGTNPVRAIDLSPDGRTLVVGDNQGNVELIDPLTRRRIRAPLKLGSRITAVRFSPDGTRLAVTTVDFDGSGNIHLLDTRTWAGHGPFDIGFGPAYLDVAAPVFSPDSRVLAADVVAANDPTFDHNVVRWDARTGRRLAAPSPIPSTREDAPALGGYTHAGTALVTSSATSGATVIRDASSLRPLRRLNGGGSPTATSADGRFVALADRRGSLRLLDLHTGRLRVLAAHVTAIRFTPDSRRLVTTGRDATLTLWDATRATPTRTIGRLPAIARALAISEDGRTAYGADEAGGVIAWDLTGGRGLGRSLELPWRRPTALAAPTASSPVVAVADAERGVELLDTQTLAPARRMPIHGGADAITVAPDGRTAAFGTHDGSVGFADLQTRQLLRPPEPSHVDAVRDLVFSPDGRWLATTDGRIVFLWDARSRRTLAAFQGVVGVATSVRFTPDSRRLVVADARPRGPGALDELSAPHLQLLRQAIVPPLSQLTFSQDGKILFGAGPGGRLWLLDTRTWKPLGAPLPANAARMAIDPTDRLLATSSTGGAVQLWDVRAGRPLGGTLPGIARRAALLAFVRGGSDLVTVQTGGTALVWDVRPRSWTRRACAIAGRPLTRAEWHDALPDLPYSPACAARR